MREAERRLREGDRGLLGRAARHLPLLPREHYLKPGSLLRHRHEPAGADVPARRPVDDGPQAPRLPVAAPRGRKAARSGGARRVPRPHRGAAPLRDRVAPARPRRGARARAARPARRQDAPRAPRLRVRRVLRGPQQRRGRDRALPRPAWFHAHVRGPHLRARPDARAVLRVRRVRADRRAVRRQGRQVPRRRDDGHVGHRPCRHARPAERAALGDPVPGVARAAPRRGAHVVQDGRRDPPRPRVPGALHGRRRTRSTRPSSAAT